MKALHLWALCCAGGDRRSPGADDEAIRYRDDSQEGGKHPVQWITVTLFLKGQKIGLQK